MNFVRYFFVRSTMVVVITALNPNGVRMAGSLDLQNTIMPRATALGIRSIEILAAYCRVSPTTLRRALDGLTGSGDVLLKANDRLAELEKLRDFLKPIPLNFQSHQEVTTLERKMRHGYVWIRILDSPESVNHEKEETVVDSHEIFGSIQGAKQVLSGEVKEV
jgi:hypothetical protein